MIDIWRHIEQEAIYFSAFIGARMLTPFVNGFIYRYIFQGRCSWLRQSFLQKRAASRQYFIRR